MSTEKIDENMAYVLAELAKIQGVLEAKKEKEMFKLILEEIKKVHERVDVLELKVK